MAIRAPKRVKGMRSRGNGAGAQVDDAFAAVVGRGRGGRAKVAPEPPSELDRVRELAPLIAGSLTATDFVETAIALNARAAEHRIEVVHGQVVEGFDGHGFSSPVTLMLSAAGELCGVTWLTLDGDVVLLRPDKPRAEA